MKLLVGVIIGVICLLQTEALANDSDLNSSIDFMPVELTNIYSPSVNPETGNWSIVLYSMVIGLEATFLISSLLTRYKLGSYALGGLQGAFAVSTGVSALTNFTEYGISPGLFLIGGLGYLAYYNFTYQGKHSNSRKFWTNFLGMNATVGLAFAATLIEPQLIDYSFGSVNIHTNFLSAGLQWVF